MALKDELQLWFEEAMRQRLVLFAGTPGQVAANLSNRRALEQTVGGLEPASRQLLRLMCRVARPVSMHLLNEAARAFFGATSAEGLLASGIAFRYHEMGFPVMLTLPAPLMGPVLSLCPADTFGTLDAPPPIDRWDERGTTFKFALMLAAIERLRPRTSGYVALHKSDRRQLVDLLSPAFDDPRVLDVMLDLALHRRFLRRASGRFAVDFGSLDVADDLGARLAYEQLGPHGTQLARSAVLARLASDDRWHPLPRLHEEAAYAVLSQPYGGPTSQQFDELGRCLAAWPGVATRDVDGTTWVRLTQTGRRLFGLEADVPTSQRSLIVQPNMELVAQQGLDPRLVAGLGRIARLESVGGAVVMRLDEEAVRRSAGEGFDAASMTAMLAAGSAHPVPSNVARTLADWADAKGTARVLTGTVLLTDAPGATLRKALKGIDLKAISAGVWLLPSRKSDAAKRALHAAGLRCEVVNADISDYGEELWPDVRESASWRNEADELVRNTLETLDG